MGDALSRLAVNGSLLGLFLNQEVFAVNLTHVRAFTEALTRKNLESMLMHMSEDVVLRTPLVSEPIQGKAAIRRVVGALLGLVDRFEFREIMQGPEHVSSFF